MKSVLRKIYFAGAAVLIMTGGVACQKAPTSPVKPTTPPTRPQKTTPRAQPKPVDPQVVQQYYDRGVQAYSRENYEEAQTLFQRVVELIPNTELGLKALENLKKTQQILKTLDKIKLK